MYSTDFRWRRVDIAARVIAIYIESHRAATMMRGTSIKAKISESRIGKEAQGVHTPMQNIANTNI
jgi:hypothetical protein